MLRNIFLVIIRLNLMMRWVVGALLVMMGILVSYAVVMRYFFNNPPVWAFDLTSWFTGLSVFLGGGYALLTNSHVRVDLFYEKFNERNRHWIDIFGNLCVLLVVTILVWKGSEQVIHNYKMNIIAMSGLNIHIWLKWLMVPLGSLLLGLQAIVNTGNHISYLLTGQSIIDIESEVVD